MANERPKRSALRMEYESDGFIIWVGSNNVDWWAVAPDGKRHLRFRRRDGSLVWRHATAATWEEGK